MAYEYENDVASALISGGMQYNSNAHYEMAGEVEEVYAKAKAFNEILNIDLDQHEIIVHGQVEDIVNKYREDK
ncbi:DUF1024 family protein [Mammaliicoccus sciuri]|uniref:DUF1024 family protein n=1 Tax=Mammaliicoccus sciuri TaxID=1296 RepID=UPI0020BF8464|nr:DUF1024 family protein [Mammaliicoccus sciuri]